MKSILIFVFSGCTLLSLSQKNDSIQVVDDLIYYHSPKKAVLLSVIIPVSGQVFNHFHFEKGQKGRNNIYWKLPLFYSAIGYTAFSLINNQNIQKELKKEYNYRINNNGQILNEEWVNYDTQGVLSLTKDYESKRDLSILVFGAAYLIQIIDAGIEAHFVNFDISQDLSLQLRPKLLSQNTVGLGLKLNFKN